MEASPGRAHVGGVHVLLGHVLQRLHRRVDTPGVQKHHEEVAALLDAAASLVVGVGARDQVPPGFSEQKRF